MFNDAGQDTETFLITFIYLTELREIICSKINVYNLLYYQLVSAGNKKSACGSVRVKTPAFLRTVQPCLHADKDLLLCLVVTGCLYRGRRRAGLVAVTEATLI